jgi:hypothetical protein
MGMASYVGQVEGDDPEGKEHPGPPCWWSELQANNLNSVKEALHLRGLTMDAGSFQE